MKLMLRKMFLSGFTVFSFLFLFGLCGAGWAGVTGKVNVSLTGSPASEFSHVWITVTGIGFHTSNAAGAGTAGWLKYPLATPVTVDLAELNNGAIQTLCQNISLPVGNYQQIRILLASTEGTLTTSASTAGLQNNNEVVTNANVVFPLQAPSGVLQLDGKFQITEDDPLNLAIVTDTDRDVIQAMVKGQAEYFLRPILTYFDLNTAGGIKGRITVTGTSGYNFVIKAEQPAATDGSATWRVVKRCTTVKKDGSFTLYPLAPGSYDILIRGRSVETFIVTGVEVGQGTTSLPSYTDLGPAIQMVTGVENTVKATVRPTGAYVNFYQTLPTDSTPYEVRFRQIDPFTGNFFDPIALSTGPLNVGAFNNGLAISFSPVDPVGGDGNFSAAADAYLYDRSTYVSVNSSTTAIDFGTLTVSAPAVAATVSGNIEIPPKMDNKHDTGSLLAIRDGLIIDRIDVSSDMATGGSFTLDNLPGGTSTDIYKLYAIGWNSAAPLRTGMTSILKTVDLRTGSASGVDLTMFPYRVKMTFVDGQN